MRAAQEDALRAIDAATQRLLRTVKRFSDRDVERPSLLPGWSRGHVLTHVAQSADAMRTLLVGARTGVPGAAYASQEARDTAIEDGARRSAAALRVELASAAERFHTEARTLPEDAWRWPVSVLGGVEFPAAQLLDRLHAQVSCLYRLLRLRNVPARSSAAR